MFTLIEGGTLTSKIEPAGSDAMRGSSRFDSPKRLNTRLCSLSSYLSTKTSAGNAYRRYKLHPDLKDFRISSWRIFKHILCGNRGQVCRKYKVKPASWLKRARKRHVTKSQLLRNTMSNNSSRNQDRSGAHFPSHYNSQVASSLLDAGFFPRDMQRKQPDIPGKPFFGAGGSMLRKFDEHHAGLTRRNSVESATATPPRSVVGIGGKGAPSWSRSVNRTKCNFWVHIAFSCETRLF